MAPDSSAHRPMGAAEWGMLLVLAAVWGGSFFFNDIAVRALPVFTVVAARVVLAALLLTVLMRLRAERLPRARTAWAAFLGMGLLNNAIPFSLIVWGQQHIASGAASILNAATPLVTVVLAHVLTSDERMTVGKVAGVAVGFAGVATMIGAAALQDVGTHVVAQLMCLGGAVSYALAGIFGRRFRAMGLSPMSAATGQLVCSGAILLPLALAVDRPWTLPPPGAGTIGALVGVAAISTALAYVLYFRILATAGATNLLLVTFLVPVTAIGLGGAFLAETLEPRHVAGMGLIGLGLAAIDGRPWRAVRSRVPHRPRPPG